VARWPQLLLSRRLCVLLSHIAGWLESAWRDDANQPTSQAMTTTGSNKINVC